MHLIPLIYFYYDIFT